MGHISDISMSTFCPLPPQTALQMDTPGCPFKTDVTTLSTESRTKSKATLLREQNPSAKVPVRETFYFQFFTKAQMTNVRRILRVVIYWTLALCFIPPELLTIQSAEENYFVIKYSPEVWKGIVNVWLGMYYDTSSKYHVTGGLWEHAGQLPLDQI